VSSVHREWEAFPLIDHRPVEAGDELLAQEPIGRRPDLADDLILPAGVRDDGLEPRRLEGALDALVEEAQQLAVGIVDLGPQFREARRAGAGAVVAVGRRLIHPDTIARDGRAVVISYCNDVFIIMSVDDLPPFGYK